MKLHHIGIFTKDINFGAVELSKIINIKKKSKIFKDDIIKVFVQFLYDCEDNCYEIVAPNGIDNPVDSVISSGKNILNHLAYITSDFDVNLSKLIDQGCIQIKPPCPAIAFNNARVVFLLTPLRMIIELIEDKPIKTKNT